MLTADPPVPGLRYVPDYLDPAEQDRLLRAVDSQPWSTELRRRVQHHGYRYDYRRKNVDRDQVLGPLPDWSTTLADRLLCDGHTSGPPNQLIVNEYLPGQGIAPHVDSVTAFGDRIVSVSLGSACVLTLRHDSAEVSILLAPGSVLALSGEARYRWTHGIAARRTDLVAGRRIARDRRVSLTFRTVVEG